jgi:4-amino-4-deoxy-L-arabinose transferase-like glycosyltransferase
VTLHAILFWRSPTDQPRWARPALLVIAALAAFTYAWGIGGVALEPFYGAAARSMSQSWHDFAFGAVDPWGTVSVDKLPGALWVQALSLRLFGFHLWAIVLPQIVEGVLTVLVLYRAVQRVAGPAAGVIAALVLALSPVTVLLNRGNISDSLLILLLVLAVDATLRALTTGRPRSLLWAGLWVGLAFQAKMIEAWLILPPLFLVYLLAGPAQSLWRRGAHVALTTLVVALVSLSWMTAISSVPASHRPYVDGSCDNSVFSQVFAYNGLDRLTNQSLAKSGCSKPSAFVTSADKEGGAVGLGTFTIAANWDRLLTGPFGRDDAWMLVPSLVSAGSVLWLRRRRPRQDLLRASTVLWVTWLIVIGAFFSGGRYLNSYYVAALLPPMAGLCGQGAVVAWQARQSRATRLLALLTLAGATLYSVALIPGIAGMRTVIIASTVAVSVLGVGLLAVSLGRQHTPEWTTGVGLAVGGVALLFSSAWATGSVLVAGEGPFDTPYQPAHVTYLSQTLPARHRASWPALNALARLLPANQAIDTIETSFVAGAEILATGREFLPVGGFSGEVPAPTVNQFRRDVQLGKTPRALVAIEPLSNNPVERWIAHHCRHQTFGRGNTFTSQGTTFQRFMCAAQRSHKLGLAVPG